MSIIERPYTSHYKYRFLSGIALLDTIENFLEERMKMINENPQLNEVDFRNEMDFIQGVIQLKKQSDLKKDDYSKEVENLILHEKRKDIFVNEGDLEKLSKMPWKA